MKAHPAANGGLLVSCEDITPRKAAEEERAADRLEEADILRRLKRGEGLDHFETIRRCKAYMSPRR